MANKTIYGRVIDSAGQPVEFATVFVSDSTGKPTYASKNTSTNDKGQFTLKDVGENEFVTARYVGLKDKTLAVKDAFDIPIVGGIGGSMPTLAFRLLPNDATMLQEVTVFAQNTIDKVKQPRYWIPIVILTGLLITSGIILKYQTKKV